MTLFLLFSSDSDFTTCKMAYDFCSQTYKYYNCEPHIYLRFKFTLQRNSPIVPNHGKNLHCTPKFIENPMIISIFGSELKY